MLKQLVVLLSILALATFVALGQTINSNTPVTVEAVNALGAGRYTAATTFEVVDWSVFGGQAIFQNEAQFEGYGLSTAGALGLSEVWNELPGNRAAKVVLNPNEPIRYLGSQYWLENCRVNGRPYKNRVKPVIPPAPPVAAAPPPAQTAPPAVAPALPLCRLGGDLEKGFVGVALNGEGKFSLNGEPVTSEKSEGADVLKLDTAPAGTSTVQYTVAGPGGSVVCENKFDVFARQPTLATLTPSVTIPKIRFCDTDRDGWRPDRMVLGMIEKVRCDPGHMILDTGLGAVGGWALTRAFPGPLRVRPPRPVLNPGKIVPPGGVISPP